MWLEHFDQRLTSWKSLRQTAAELPVDQCLTLINAWWFQSPWQAYYLHWDDRSSWPNPWELLADNVYCELARALGMLYTIVLLDRPDIADAQLVETTQGNLVLVHREKYILNWDRDVCVNTNLEYKKIKHQLSQVELKKQLN